MKNIISVSTQHSGESQSWAESEVKIFSNHKQKIFITNQTLADTGGSSSGSCCQSFATKSRLRLELETIWSQSQIKKYGWPSIQVASSLLSPLVFKETSLDYKFEFDSWVGLQTWTWTWIATNVLKMVCFTAGSYKSLPSPSQCCSLTTKTWSALETAAHNWLHSSNILC